jgi:low temperature requirement protein LtrA
VSPAERELEPSDEHQVTPLELFFDLVFVFALTQVTSLLVDDPTWGGVLRGMLVLAALWWAWAAYAWLTSATDVDEGGVRLTMLASMGAMFGVALAVPGAFGDDAVLFGVAYLLVRLLHLDLSATVARADPDRRSALLRFAPTAMLGPSLLVLAGLLGGTPASQSGSSRLRSTTSARACSGSGAAGGSRPSTSPNGTHSSS